MLLIFASCRQVHFERCQPLVKEHHHTEQRAPDNYLILAAHILWELWVDPDAKRDDTDGAAAAEHDKYFWKAVVLLEYTLKLSPSNFNARFLLVKLYNQAGKYSFMFMPVLLIPDPTSFWIKESQCA